MNLLLSISNLIQCRLQCRLQIVQSRLKYYRFCYDQVPSYIEHQAASNDDLTHRFVARVSYDGTNFRGWQQQSDSSLRTVQGVVSATISKRFQSSVRITGASRTDAGVHARGQAIHFDLNVCDIDCRRLEYTLNRMLPDDVKLYNISIAPTRELERFHATSSALSKIYTYHICTNSFVEPILRNYCTHLYMPLNMPLLEKALWEFVGTHDFISFGNQIEHTFKSHHRRAIKKNSLVTDDVFLDRESHQESLAGDAPDAPFYTTTRTIYDIRLQPSVVHGEGYYRIDFHIQSALYQMIRNILGTAVLVAAGRMSLSQLRDLVRTAPGRRHNPAKALAPHGLTLEHVFYEDF